MNQLATMRQRAREVDENIQNGNIGIAYAFLKQGKWLKEMRDEELFKYLGEGGYDSFAQYLAGPDVSMKRSTAYMYIHIYEFYVLKMEMKEEEVVGIGSYKLQRLMPILKDKTKAEVGKVLDDINGLGTSDTEIVLKENGVDPYRRPAVYRCPTCNKWIIRYYEDSVCQCDGVFKLINEGR